MYAARLLTVLLIILAVVATYSPQVHEQAINVWEEIKPTVIGITDSLFVTIQNLISGDGSRDRMDETPDPGRNFERIVTLNGSFAL